MSSHYDVEKELEVRISINVVLEILSTVKCYHIILVICKQKRVSKVSFKQLQLINFRTGPK